MSYPIPKIQYKNLSTNGATTSGGYLLTAIPDTSAIEVGMFVTGNNIPANTTVVIVTAAAVTMSAPATGSALGVALEFGFEVSFDYPPKEPAGEEMKTSATVTVALSGKRQTAVNYIEGIRKPVFSFVEPAIFDKLVTFLETYALLGKTFRYFEDKTLSSYVEYELENLDLNPKKIAGRSATTYLWEAPLSFRRVI